MKCSNWTKFEFSSLKNGPRNDQDAKISNQVNMCIFNELRCWFSKASKILLQWICIPNIKSIKGIFFIHRVNGALLTNVARKHAKRSLTRQIWGIWKLRPAYSPERPNLGQNRWCFVPCDLEIWWMTLENNRAPLLCCFKLATFHSHQWIQTGVAVRKRPIWVKFYDF